MAAFVNNVGDGIGNKTGYKHEYNAKSYRNGAGIAGTYCCPGYRQRYDPIKLVDAICDPNNLSTFPSRQPFPVTAADLAAVIGGGLLAANITEIWACDEASGNLVGKIAGTVLTAAGTPLYSRRTPGMIVQPVSGAAEDVTAWAYRNAAVELFTAGSDSFAKTTTGIGDLTGSSMTVLCICRIRPSESGALNVLGRGTIGGGPLWLLTPSGAFGSASRIRVRNSVGADVTSTSTTQLVDGAYHCTGFVWDGANIRIHIDGNLEGAAAAPAGTVSQASSTLALGLLPGVTNGAPMQILYLVFLNVSLTGAQLANFWNFGKKPGGFPNATTYARNSQYALIMGTFPGSSAAGDLACYYNANAPQFAWGAAPNASGSNPLAVGLGSVTAKTNRVLQSIDPTTTWALTGAVLTPNSVTSPCGMVDAHQLVPSAATDKLEQNTGFAVPASGSFSFAISMRRLAVSANSVRLTIFGTTGGSVSATFAPTRNWDRFEVNSGALPGALTGNIGVRIEPDVTNGSATLVFWEPFGDSRSDTPAGTPDPDVIDIISTTTAAVTGAAATLSLQSGVSVLVPQDFIRVDARFSLPYSTANASGAGGTNLLLYYAGDNAGNNFLQDIFGNNINQSRSTVSTAGATRSDIRITPAALAADSDNSVISKFRMLGNFDGAHAGQYFVNGTKGTTYTTDPVAPITAWNGAFQVIDWGNKLALLHLNGITYRQQVYREYFLTS